MFRFVLFMFVLFMFMFMLMLMANLPIGNCCVDFTLFLYVGFDVSFYDEWVGFLSFYYLVMR